MHLMFRRGVRCPATRMLRALQHEGADSVSLADIYMTWDDRRIPSTVWDCIRIGMAGRPQRLARQRTSYCFTEYKPQR
jgi:hypothetical protein